MCNAFTECVYYSFNNIIYFFSDVNLFMELLMTQRQFLQAIEVNWIEISMKYNEYNVHTLKWKK